MRRYSFHTSGPWSKTSVTRKHEFQNIRKYFVKNPSVFLFHLWRQLHQICLCALLLPVDFLLEFFFAALSFQFLNFCFALQKIILSHTFQIPELISPKHLLLPLHQNKGRDVFRIIVEIYKPSNQGQILLSARRIMGASNFCQQKTALWLLGIHKTKTTFWISKMLIIIGMIISKCCSCKLFFRG